MRLAALLLLASGAAAQGDHARTIADRIQYGFQCSAGLALRYFEKERIEFLRGRPELVLDICRRATDTGLLLEFTARKPDEGKRLADHLDALVATVSGPKADLARLEARAFRAKIERLQGKKSGAALRDAAVGISKTAGDADGALRAAELLLQVLCWSDEDRAPALEALSKIAAQEGLPEPARAALRAAPLLADAEAAIENDPDGAKSKVEEGLRLLGPHVEEGPEAVVRRYNDFVTLAARVGVKAKYRPVVTEAYRGSLRLPIPLSRRWSVFVSQHSDGSSTVDLWLLRESGEAQCKVDLRRYGTGTQYPPAPRNRKGKRADGGNPRKLAEIFMEEEMWLFLPSKRKKQGPRGTHLGRGVKKAYKYEVWGAWGRERWRRVRAIFFGGKSGWSYSLRMVEDRDFGDEWHPELLALLDDVELKS